MRLRVYEQLYLANMHLVAASHEIETLGKHLKVDRTALQLMTAQLDEVRRDVNCSFSNEIHDRELLTAKSKPTRNWRLRDLQDQALSIKA